MVELISLIRLLRRLPNKSILLALLLPVGIGVSLAEGISLYDGLLKEIAQRRADLYNSLIKELMNIEAKMKVEPEKTKEAKTRQFEALPQKVEQWRKENPSSLLSLRLQILTAQVGRKNKEAQELESQLNTDFQSLLSQWSSPPKIEETTPQPEKRISLAPPSPPSPLSPWWKSPSLIHLPSPASEFEKEITNEIVNFSQLVDKEKQKMQEKMVAYERVLKEVKRRCPLP
ncbi:hypothetical protein H5T88_08025 [bacterium]|nr:hypothetical protein [bacterium]